MDTAILMAILFLGMSAILVYLGYCLYAKIKEAAALTKNLEKATLQLEVEQQQNQDMVIAFSQLKSQFDQEILHDPITMLPGRLVFDDRLVNVFYQSKRFQLSFAILFVDIDGFKIINDALGYDVGDQLLKEVGSRIHLAVRQMDTVARFSGDTFVVILPQIAKAESAAYVAQRLLDEISQPIVLNHETLFVTASIGIACYPQDGDDPKIVSNNASTALHQAKARGNNTYQFYRAEMQTVSRRELILQSSLRKASVYDEFSLLYQPQVDVRSKKITCMEALLRWQHPDFGLIVPNDFIRLAEYSGKILMIGEWVLETACEQFQKWSSIDFHPGRVAVNISWKQLENPHFIFRLSQILQERKMDPSCLVLEISEIVLLQKTELIEKTFHMLKNIGVKLAIDDFGTGHLSLPRLQRFPVDYLKMDGSLVQALTNDPDSQVIPRMIMSLAKSLAIDVIAEEVETTEQKQILQQKLECFIMQGHLFSLPQPAQEFTQAFEKKIFEKIA